MANIIDLSVVAQEPITLKFGEDDTFTIPPEPSVKLTTQIIKFESKMNESQTHEEQFKLAVELATQILKQDDVRNVDTSFVEDNLSLSQMFSVINIYKNKMVENTNDPN